VFGSCSRNETRRQSGSNSVIRSTGQPITLHANCCNIPITLKNPLDERNRLLSSTTVDLSRDHPWGFPCCVWSPMHTCHRHYPGRSEEACPLVYLHRLRPSLCNSQVAPAIVFSGPAQRSLMLWPARSPSRLATLYVESSDSFVASAAASIATGWSKPVPGRELHTLKSSAFHGALLRQQSAPPGPRDSISL
jgi:hypothetical protein